METFRAFESEAKRRERTIRWLARYFGLGLLVVVVALGIARLVTWTIAPDWEWRTVAMALLALGAFLILGLLTRPGLTPPGAVVGYDLRDAFIELMGRETNHTVTTYRPSQGGIDALTNMLPPAIAFLIVIV